MGRNFKPLPASCLPFLVLTIFISAIEKGEGRREESILFKESQVTEICNSFIHTQKFKALKKPLFPALGTL